MIRFVFRFIGLLILAAGFAALVRDGTQTIADNTLKLTKLGQDWYNLSPNTLQLLQPGIERHVAVWLWPPIQTILEQPTCIVLVIVGAILILIGRKKKPLIGYARD